MTSDPRESSAIGRIVSGGGTPTVVLIGGEVVKGLADRLHVDHEVLLLSDDERIVRAARERGVDAQCLDLADGGELERHASDADVAIVGAERDRRNLLAAQLLRVVCGIERVVVRLNDPANRDAFRDVDAELLDAEQGLGDVVDRALADVGP